MCGPAADPVGARWRKLTSHPLVTVEQAESGPEAATIALAVSCSIPTPVGPVHPAQRGTVCGGLIPFSSTTDTSLLRLFATAARPSRGNTATPIGPCPTDKGLCGRVVPVVRSTSETVPSPLLVTTATSRSGSTATLDGRFPTTTGWTTVSSVVLETLGPGFGTFTCC